jgi:hypothetical protein
MALLINYILCRSRFPKMTAVAPSASHDDVVLARRTMPPVDPISGAGKGPPPENACGFDSFIPPGRNGWAQNHFVDPEWEPGDGKPQLIFNLDDLFFEEQYAVGSSGSVNAILASPISNTPPGSPGEPYIPAIFAPQPFPPPIEC